MVVRWNETFIDRHIGFIFFLSKRLRQNELIFRMDLSEPYVRSDVTLVENSDFVYVIRKL